MRGSWKLYKGPGRLVILYCRRESWARGNNSTYLAELFRLIHDAALYVVSSILRIPQLATTIIRYDTYVELLL